MAKKTTKDIVKTDDTEMLEIVKASDLDDDVFSALAAGAFLPRVQLLTSQSKLVKKGEFEVNHYGLISSSGILDLGSEVDVWVLGCRAKALSTLDDVLYSYDIDSEIFKDIQSRVNEKDSGCMAGPEFLLYLPEQETFATFLMASKSAIIESSAVKARMGKTVTLKSKFIETKKFAWWAPTAMSCSTPLDKPKMDELKSVLDKFKNAPEMDVELAKEEAPEAEASDSRR